MNWFTKLFKGDAICGYQPIKRENTNVLPPPSNLDGKQSRKVKLVVVFNDKSSFSCSATVTDEDLIEEYGDKWYNIPFVDFLRWFHDTEEPTFVSEAINGQSLIVRKDINYYRVVVIDEEKT
jgi:hypothetical protein